MSSIKNVVIAGASGNLGPFIVKALLEVKIINVSVFTRPDSDATFPSGVKVIKTDYTPASLNTIFANEKFDAVVSALNLTKPGLVEADAALIRAAKGNGVKRFFTSEFGTDTSNKELVSMLPAYFAGKINSTKLASSLQGEGFTWTGLITGVFFDWGLKANFLGPNFSEKKFYRFDGGNTPFTTTNLATIGKAIAKILSDDAKLSATANKYVYISSHTITANQLIDAVNKATGETWPIEEGDTELLEKNAIASLKGGNPYAAYDLLKVALWGKKELGNYKALVTNDYLGLPEEDLGAQVKEFITSLKQ